MLKYVKLAEIFMVQMIGSIEDKRCFNYLNDQTQVPQLIDNEFQACNLDVCSTILHVGEFFIPLANCNLERNVSLIWI